MSISTSSDLDFCHSQAALLTEMKGGAVFEAARDIAHGLVQGTPDSRVRAHRVASERAIEQYQKCVKNGSVLGKRVRVCV